MIKREEFEKRKAASESARNARLNKRPKKLLSQGKDLSSRPLLQVCHRLRRCYTLAMVAAAANMHTMLYLHKDAHTTLD